MLVGIRNGTAVYTYITGLGHAGNDPVQCRNVHGDYSA